MQAENSGELANRDTSAADAPGTMRGVRSCGSHLFPSSAARLNKEPSLPGAVCISKFSLFPRRFVSFRRSPMSFSLPDLPYSHDALGPHMSKETLEYHH